MEKKSNNLEWLDVINYECKLNPSGTVMGWSICNRSVDGRLDEIWILEDSVFESKNSRSSYEIDVKDVKIIFDFGDFGDDCF